MQSVCVYCGSRHGTDPRHSEAARTLGREIAARGLRMVYGGGGVGLMGETARAAAAAGADVLGVIPEFLVELEGAGDIVECKIVDSMHERKMIMYEAADAFLVLPGGVGTLEELVETLSWAHLDLHAKPLIMIDVAGYWGPWFKLMDHMIAEGFLTDGVRERIHASADPVSALDLAEKLCATTVEKPATTPLPL